MKNDKKCSFQPDHVAKRLHQCLIRDLNPQGFHLGGSENTPEVLYDPSAYFANHQSTCFLKKYKSSDTNQEELANRCIQKFMDINANASSINHSFAYPTFGSGVLQDDVVGRILVAARWLIHDLVGDLDTQEWFKACDVSSGTTLGLKFEKTNIEDKFTYPITCTDTAKGALELLFSWDHQLDCSVREMNRYSDSPRYRIVPGSRVTTVDKDDRARRMIAIEPTGNMFLQLGLMTILYKRLKLFGLDLSSLPQKHAELAYIGSITSKVSTIDFSSASDSVTTSLVSYLFPPDWVKAFNICRSPVTSCNGEELYLDVYATMGNATTFPIETIVFYALAVATTAYYNDNPLSVGQFKGYCSVFGDDVILPTDVADLFILVSSVLGFSVNREKSFFSREGRFRESCGSDFLSGRNVRPFYLKAPTSSRKSSLEPWLYSIFNGTLEKYISYFGPVKALYQSLPREVIRIAVENGIDLKFVPSHYPDDSGIKAFDLFDRLKANILDPLKAKVSPVYLGQHGTVRIRYTRFVYSRNKGNTVDLCNRSDELRYWHALRQASNQQNLNYLHVILARKTLCLRSHALLSDYFYRTAIEPRYLSKKVGGYVVASSIVFMN